MKSVILVLLLLCVSFVFATENELQSLSENESDAEGRKKRFGFKGLFGMGFGFHALAILYWIKVKLIIIAFAIGTAFIWGVRYFWAHKKDCPKTPEAIHEGPIHYLDHHPSGYSFDSPGLDPYSGWSSYAADSSQENPTSHPNRRVTRSSSTPFDTEEEIAEAVFSFLGVDSSACRRRFLCEVEFKSQHHPLTRLAFRIVGRGIFGKYARNANDHHNVAQSFAECATANSECIFIQENQTNEEEYTTEDDNPDLDYDLQVNTTEPTQEITVQEKRDPLAESILRRSVH